MNRFSKMNLEEIVHISSFISANRSNPSIVVDKLGVISSDNGYGTKFLIPNDPLFKVIWVHEKNNQLTSVGLGGPSWELTLGQIVSYYGNHTEGYNRYDDEYEYVFYKNSAYDYAIKISSKSLLFNQGTLTRDIDVNQIVVVLR